MFVFFIFEYLQVAFGVDFTKSDGSDLSQPQKFSDLVFNTFSGVHESLMNPFFRVIIVCVFFLMAIYDSISYISLYVCKGKHNC